jgi:hypothetical protein
MSVIQTATGHTDFKRLKKVLAGGVSFAFVDNRMFGKVGEPVVWIMLVIE